MSAAKQPPGLPSIAGLCSNCRHSQVLESDRGSTFLLCQLSRTDRSFPKYPRVPVLICRGYVAKTAPP